MTRILQDNLHDAEAVRALLEQGRAEVDERDDADTTPLMRCVARNLRESARVLLAAGADTETRDVKGWTALIMACDAHPCCVGTLIDFGADVNDNIGQYSPITGGYASALYLACRNGWTGIVGDLLDAGASVDTASLEVCRLLDHESLLSRLYAARRAQSMKNLQTTAAPASNAPQL